MSLLTTPYDPVGAASVIVRALEMGQQRQQHQESMLADLAKQISDSRRHAVEFDRVQQFNDAKLAEETRRYNLENAPITPTSPTSFSGGTSSTSPAADLPVSDLPEMSAPSAPPPLAPETMANPYSVSAGGLSTSGPFSDSGNGEPQSRVIDSVPLPDAAPASPAADLGGGAPLDPLAAEAQNIADTTVNGPHGKLVPRAGMANLQTPAGRAATIGNPLIPEALPDRPGFSGGSDLITEARNQMASMGVPAKIAKGHLADLAVHIAEHNAAPTRQLPKLPDGSIVLGGKQYVRQADGSYKASTITGEGTGSVEEYQAAKKWSKDVSPHSPTFGALIDTDGAAHWVHVGGNGKVVDIPARPPAGRVGFDEKAKAKELGYVPKDGMWFDPETGIYHRPGENGFIGVTPRTGPAEKAARRPTTTEQIWATANAPTVDRVGVVKPLLDKAGLDLASSYDDMKVAIEKGTLTKPQADYANYWLGKFREQAGSKVKEASDLGKLFNVENAKLKVLKDKGVTVTPIDPKELRNAMLEEGAKSPDPAVADKAKAALAKQGITPSATPAPASTPAPKAKTIWKQDEKGNLFEYDAETKKPTGMYRPAAKAA